MVSPKHPRFGPITREEHDLQLWYNGLEPRQPRQQPQNLLGSKSYEEYKQLYFLPEHVLTNGDTLEGRRQGNDQRDRPRLEEEEEDGENRTLDEPRQHFGEEGDGDAAAAEVQPGPRNADVVERRQGIVGTGRILRATALAVS